MDDVINVSGHRLGTAEIEDALVRPHTHSHTHTHTHTHSHTHTQTAALSQTEYLLLWSCLVLQDEHPAVPETAVVGFPHDIKGEGELNSHHPLLLPTLMFIWKHVEPSSDRQSGGTFKIKAQR